MLVMSISALQRLAERRLHLQSAQAQGQAERGGQQQAPQQRP